MRRVPKRWAVPGAAWLAVVAVAAGCSGPSHGSRSAAGGGRRSAPPQSQQAYAVALKEFGLLAGGGWAQAWSLWTDSARRAVPRADFVRVNTECRPVLGVPYVIDTTTVADPTTVRVDWHRGGATGSDTLLYEAGQWRFAPGPGTLAGYRSGAARAVRDRRAAGSCH